MKKMLTANEILLEKRGDQTHLLQEAPDYVALAAKRAEENRVTEKDKKTVIQLLKKKRDDLYSDFRKWGEVLRPGVMFVDTEPGHWWSAAGEALKKAIEGVEKLQTREQVAKEKGL